MLTAPKFEGGWLHGGGTYLNGLTIPVQAPTLDAKLAARGYRIDLHHCLCFIEVSPMVEKAVSCLKADEPTRSVVAKHT